MKEPIDWLKTLKNLDKKSRRELLRQYVKDREYILTELFQHQR